LDYGKIQKKTASIRGPYRDYSRISTYQKNQIITKIKNGGRGELSKMVKNTKIPRQTLQNWVKQWDPELIPLGKYRKRGGGRKSMLEYECECLYFQIS
jgi:hypothetical protein